MMSTSNVPISVVSMAQVACLVVVFIDDDDYDDGVASLVPLPIVESVSCLVVDELE